MKFKFIPKTILEKFTLKVYNSLVENSKDTYLTGGTVRDLLLFGTFKDADIATALTPKQVKKIFQNSKIKLEQNWQTFGVSVAKLGSLKVEITTFRKDYYTKTRYPKVSFIHSAKIDSQRRDFSINSLYFSPKLAKIFDFQNGFTDIKTKTVKFIGNPNQKINEDPLRIVRAIRFALDLDFKIEAKTFLAIKENYFLLSTLTKNKIENEILKSRKKQRLKKILTQNIFDKSLFLR